TPNLRLSEAAKWPFAGGKSAPQRWGAGLRMVLRVQIVGWSAFTAVDTVTNRLLQVPFPGRLYRTALLGACVALFTWGMRAFYSSPRFRNRLSAQALTWVVVLSLAGATVEASLLFAGREVFGWATPGRAPIEDFMLPLLHALVVLL